MSENNTQEVEETQKQNSQEETGTFVDPFDNGGYEIQDEEEEDIPFRSFTDIDDSFRVDEEKEEDKKPEEEEEGKKNEIDLFDEEKDDKEKDDKSEIDLSEEDKIIEALKAKGYDIKKEENQTLEEKHSNELKQLDDYINNANSFLNQPEDKIIEANERSVLINKYKSTGKESQINSEDFNFELEAAIEEIKENSTMKNLYVKNVKNEISNILKEKTNEKEAINTKINEEKDKIINENRTNLQSSFKQIFESENFLGIKVSKEEINKAYNSVNNRELSEQLNNSPELVAKVALFVGLQEKLMNNSTNGTYGEGVKAAIDSLKGNSSAQKTNNPLTQGLSSRNGGGSQEVKQSIERFKSNIIKDDVKKDDKDKHVAGQMNY